MKNIITLKGITGKQRDALVAGGLSFTALGMGLGLYKLLGGNHAQPTRVASSSAEISPDTYSDEVVETPIAEEAIASYEAVETSEATISYSFSSEVVVSNLPNDTMTFEEAFSVARQDAGPGGFFNYRGESYSTFYKEEWEGMSEDNQNDFFAQVDEQSDFIQDEHIVSDYEVMEAHEDFHSDEDAMGEDDFFSDLDVEATEIEDRSVETVNPIQTTPHQELETPSTDLISEDDFFNDLEADADVVIVRPVFGTDSNDDGLVDMIALDDNEDGIADVVALDEDYDGNYESFMVNTDGGDNLDVFIVDQGLDGIDPSDSREDIDDIISMDDFVIVDENDVESIENMEMIEGLIDGVDGLAQDNDIIDDSSDNDFDEIGL